MSRDKLRQIRSVVSDLKVEETEGDMYLEGYFTVFNRETELWPGAFEEVSPGAFDNTLENDIRALINHDTTLVLGRNKANTLELKTDDHGLWGRVKINPNDTDAVNTYERVKRGDVSGNSFGFNITKEEEELRDDGSIKWIIKEIDLHEVSICTFPAYEDTTIEARQKQLIDHKERKLNSKKNNLKARLDKICY